MYDPSMLACAFANRLLHMRISEKPSSPNAVQALSVRRKRNKDRKCKFKNVLIAIFILTLTGMENTALATNEPSATPYRPTVSTPANLSEPGWLELETGGQRTRSGDSVRRDSISYTLKYAFARDWGIRVGGDAWVRQLGTDGSKLSGFGDTAVIAKRRFSLNENATFGLEGGVNLPTAKDGLGRGKTDYLVTGIYSADWHYYHTDLNLSATRLGQITDGESRVQAAWAASLSRALGDRWSVAGEFSGTYRRSVPSSAQFLVAASYNYSKRIVFDAGTAFGLNRVSPDWSVFAGMTMLIGKIQ